MTSSMNDSSLEFARVRCIFHFWGKLSSVCSSFAGVPSPWCGDVWKNPLARNMLLKLLTQRNSQREVRHSIRHSFSARGAVGWRCFVFYFAQRLMKRHWLLKLFKLLKSKSEFCGFWSLSVHLRPSVWLRICKSWVITL